MKKWMLMGAVLLLASPVWSAPQSVTLSVPGMTCATCPITVKKALARVEGVIDVKSSLAKRETTVSPPDKYSSIWAAEISPV